MVLASHDGPPSSPGGRRLVARCWAESAGGHLPAIAALLHPDAAPVLPPWPYRRWLQVLQYHDLGDRARQSTREQGRQRDEVLSHPAVAALVAWAAGRRRRDPIAGAAAALAALAALQACPAHKRPEDETVAQQVTDAVDRARPLQMAEHRRDAPLLHPERLPTMAADEPRAEHPKLPAVVGSLLRLGGADPVGALAERMTGAVLQAADWWAAHAVAVPAAVDGPGLPGIMAAQELPPAERLPRALGDVELLGLVAGPHPGRGRPCQVAWRRGLTYWTAVGLADAAALRPPAATVRWWRTQLTALTADSDGACTVSSSPTAAAATGSPRNVRL